MEFDYIIVGGGSAGSVLASRLTESPDVRVLLLEAGEANFPPNVENPSLWYTLFGTEVDWGYQTTPQPGLDGRVTYEPRGKLPGGSSNLYIMMHVRGHASDFDNWAYNGAVGWSYQELLPYFQKLEDQEADGPLPDDTSPQAADRPLAGKGGPIPCLNAGKHNPNPTSRAFIDACLELGFPATADFNGPQMEGAGWHHINVKDGKRHSAYAGYLKPALSRPNLTVETGVQATRLLFDGARCVGVEYGRAGGGGNPHWGPAARRLTASRCEREVIVCCGAIESPKLLLLSGIGDPEQLKQHGIPVLADLPGVGENFHNHVLTGLIRECSQPVPPPNLNLSEAALFCKSNPGWVGPDLQIGFVHVPWNIIVGQGHPNSVSILPGVVRPLSRGWIRLASADPFAKPLVNPNYLGVKSDLDRLTQACWIARDLFATKTFRPWVKDELMPGPEVKTDAEMRAWVRQSADSYHHQAGSCKMGLDATSVVDPELKVHGVEGLRVADASVMPFVPSGNCHAAILAIGEKLADILKG